MRWSRAAALALSVLSSSSLSGCHSCQRESPERQAQQPIVARVPLPPTALGEWSVPDPARLWAALRELTGGRFIAANLEMQIAESLGLSPLAAGQIVVQSPIRGLLLQEQGEASLVWAVRLKSSAELETLLTKGSQATFTAHKLPSGETLLSPKEGTSTRQLAVLGSHLIVAFRRDQVPLASRYLTQSFPAEPAVGSGVKPYVTLEFNQRGLQQGLGEPLRQAWQAQRANLALLLDQQTAARGRPADYADPSNVLNMISTQVQETLDVVSGLERVVIQLNGQQGGVALSVTLEAKPNGAAQKWFAGLSPGPALSWSGLSSKVRVLASHSIALEAEGQGMAQRLQDLFSERLAAADLARIKKAFTTLSAGLGVHCNWGWISTGDTGALFLVTQVRDAAAFKQGLAATLELHTVPVLRTLATDYLNGARFTPVKHNIAGDAVEGYRLVGGSASSSTQVLWAVHGDLGYVVLGPASEQALQELLVPTQTLGDQPELRAILGQGPLPATTLLIYGNSPGPTGVLGFASITSTAAGAALRLQVNSAMIQSALPWLSVPLLFP